MQLAFDGVGSMPMQRIRDFRTVKQAVVDSEMQKRENRAQLRKSVSINSSPNSKAAPMDGTSPCCFCLSWTPFVPFHTACKDTETARGLAHCASTQLICSFPSEGSVYTDEHCLECIPCSPLLSYCMELLMQKLLSIYPHMLGEGSAVTIPAIGGFERLFIAGLAGFAERLGLGQVAWSRPSVTNGN